MSQPAYKPRAGALDAEVLWYLSRHPGAALTCDDIDAQFDCVRGNIHTQLRPALDAGLLVRGLNEDDEITYAAGPNLVMHLQPDVHKPGHALSANEAADGLNKLRLSIVTPYSAKAALPPVPALQAIKIEDDVPLPPARAQPIDWKPMLLQLEPQQSFAVPLRHKFVLASHVSQLHREKKGTWTLRADREADQVRVWRLPDPTPATNPSTTDLEK